MSLVYNGGELGALRMASCGGERIRVFVGGVYLAHGGEVDVCGFDGAGLLLAVALVAAI